MAVVVISGGSDGMGRALAVERAERGDTVVAIGSRAEGPGTGGSGTGGLGTGGLGTGGPGTTYIRADLRSIAENRRVIAEVAARWPVVDALILFANRQSRHRTVTVDGLEETFAVYYLSRYLLGHGLAPQLERADRPVIVNVAGVGMTRGAVHWDDPQLTRGYSTIAAQLQAGRANDLLGAGHSGKARYVLYHPGFTRSGNLSRLPFLTRNLIRVLARVAAHPVADSIHPIHAMIDNPPAAQLTAIDRGRELPLDLPTLDPAAARRLATLTESLLQAAAPPP